MRYLVLELCEAGGDEGLPRTVYLDKVAVFQHEVDAVAFSKEHHCIIDTERADIVKTGILGVDDGST